MTSLEVVGAEMRLKFSQHILYASGPKTFKEASGLCRKWWHQHRTRGPDCCWRWFQLSCKTKGNALIIYSHEPSSAISDKCQVLVLESWLEMPCSGILVIYLSVDVLLCAFGQQSYVGYNRDNFFWPMELLSSNGPRYLGWRGL